MTLRPDERAVESEIERDKQFRGNIGKAVKTSAGAGLAAGLGASGIAGKVLPWLSQYIPADLAMKGLRKVSPKIADFLQRGVSMGLDVKEGMDYVKDQITPKETQEPAKEQRNVIEQYDPELHTYILQDLKKGKSLLDIGQKALTHRRFKTAIDKLTKDHKAPWSAILQSVYGSGQTAQPQQPPEQTQQAPQQQGQGSEQIDPMLQKLIDQGTGFMNKFKGK